MDINLWNLKGMPFMSKNLLLIILLSFSFSPGGAQEDHSLRTDSLALDESIRYGRLANGLTYFIKSLPTPQPKLYLRLHGKAGMNQEDSDQLSLAHAVEHLAFKQSKNFSSGIRAGDHLTGMGMDMYDLYAYTARKNVTYFFNAPPDNEEALDLGLGWFKDVVFYLKLSDKDIDQVRGELRQEAVTRSGDELIEQYTEDQLHSQIFPCSQNTRDIFRHYESFSPESLRRFYQDQYRPDLFALSIVGAIDDLDAMERKINEVFSGIHPDKDQPKLKNCAAQYFERPPQFVKVKRPRDTTKVLQNSEVYLSLFFRDPASSRNLHNMNGIKRLVLMRILVDVLRDRFREATNEYTSVYLGTKHLYESRTLPAALEVITKSQDGSEKEALKKAIRVIDQLRNYGVLETEWDKAKQMQLRSVQSEGEENAEYWNNEIMRYYVYGEALPPEKSADLEMWLTSYALKDFNIFVSQFLSKEPEDIGIVAPDKSKALLYTEKEVRSWIEGARKEPSEPYKIPEIPAALMSTEEVRKLAHVASIEKERGPTGATELVLDNGVKVILKSLGPTSGNSAKLKLHGFSLKGASCFKKEDYFSAVNAPEIVKNSGVKGMDKFQINRFLLSTGLRPGSISPYIHDKESGIYGDTSEEDLETALQLIYLYFTEPNKSAEAYEDWQERQTDMFRDPSYNLVSTDFRNAMQEFLGEKPATNIMGRITRAGTSSFEGAKKTDPDKAFNIYKSLFGNARDFTFIMSGNFDMETVVPLVQKYLGNLPNSSPSPGCTTKKDEKDLPEGPVWIKIPGPKYYRIKNVSYGIRFVEEAENTNDWQEQLKIEALGAITNKKIWSLRFEKGYSLYNPGARGYYNRDMGRYEVGVKVECIPEELPQIRKELKHIISEIKSGMISEGEFQQGMERMYSLYDAKRASLPRIVSQKLFHYNRYGERRQDPIEVESFVKNLKINDIIETANKYYKQESLFEFTMKDR